MHNSIRSDDPLMLLHQNEGSVKVCLCETRLQKFTCCHPVCPKKMLRLSEPTVFSYRNLTEHCFVHINLNGDINFKQSSFTKKILKHWLFHK